MVYNIPIGNGMHKKNYYIYLKNVINTVFLIQFVDIQSFSFLFSCKYKIWEY